MFASVNIDGMVPRQFAQGVASMAFGRTTNQVNRELVDYWVERWCTLIPARAVYYQGNSWLYKPDLSEAIADIKVPTLLISGAEDMAQPTDRIKPMADALPDAELVEIPGAGHMTNLEQAGFGQ